MEGSSKKPKREEYGSGILFTAATRMETTAPPKDAQPQQQRKNKTRTMPAMPTLERNKRRAEDKGGCHAQGEP